MSRRAIAPRILPTRVISRAVLMALPALVFAACSGRDDPQVPTTLEKPAATNITGQVGSTASLAPSVTIKDQKGKGIAGIWVRWVATAGSGKVVNDSSKTDGSGVSLSGGWTLGTVAGPQTLTASAAGLSSTTFTAQAAAGPLQTLLAWSAVQTAVVNTTLPIPPAVRALDAYDNPIISLAVTFIVAGGGGTISGPQQTTNSNGVATATSWTLGTFAGDQLLLVSSNVNGISTTLTARAIGGAAATITLVDGNGQIGYANKRLCTSPSVRLLDQYGNAVGQVPVVFTPAGNSGTVTNGSVLSDATSGYATVGGWNLSTGAQQTLTATSTALPGKQVVFTATTAPAPGYSICARYIGDGGTPRQREAVTKAVARWQSIIVGHVKTSRLTASANECTSGIPAINEDVEDLLLYVQLAAIDGPKNIIGQASPCYIHQPIGLTAMGFLQLDVADLDLMLAEGTLDNVVLHEIGHILGIGTLWSFAGRSLLTGRGSSDPFFSGAAARDGFALTGSTYAGTPVPVENSGGAGTRDGHWRATIFNKELMQGYVASTMPLSRVTIGSLADLGYSVNMSAADVFSLLPALRIGDEEPGRELKHDIADTPIWGIEGNGAKKLLRVPATAIKR